MDPQQVLEMMRQQGIQITPQLLSQLGIQGPQSNPNAPPVQLGGQGLGRPQGWSPTATGASGQTGSPGFPFLRRVFPNVFGGQSGDGAGAGAGAGDGEDEGFSMWEQFKQQENPVVFGAQLGGAAGGLLGSLYSLFGDKPDNLLKAYRELRTAYENLDDPVILKQVWNSPVIQQIANFQPELLGSLKERIDDYETYGEGDVGLRSQEDEALARITDRARRGDPLGQRLASRQVAQGVGRAMGRGAQTADSAMARRGLQGQQGRGINQAAMVSGAQMGTQGAQMGRRDQLTAEGMALTGSSGIRRDREAAKERALNVRNNFRNAMSNRQLAINMSNQKARQAASDRDQGLAQSIHERNLYAADQRRIMNQRQRNQWSREEYGFDRQRLQDRERMDLGIAGQEDMLAQRQMDATMGIFQGGGQILGAGLGMYAGGTGGGANYGDESEA